MSNTNLDPRPKFNTVAVAEHLFEAFVDRGYKLTPAQISHIYQLTDSQRYHVLRHIRRFLAPIKGVMIAYLPSENVWKMLNNVELDAFRESVRYELTAMDSHLQTLRASLVDCGRAQGLIGRIRHGRIRTLDDALSQALRDADGERVWAGVTYAEARGQ